MRPTLDRDTHAYLHVSLQATGGDQQMLDMLVEATASREAADRWRWKNADAALSAAVVETEASRQLTTSLATLHHRLPISSCVQSVHAAGILGTIYTFLRVALINALRDHKIALMPDL